MTAHPTQPAPPSADSPPTPPTFIRGGPPVPRIRSHRRTRIAAAAFVVAAAAATTTAVALASPPTPARHTINIEPNPPATYTSAEIQAAKDTACMAWDSAARSTARAAKASTAALEVERNSQAPASAAALAAEKRTGIAATKYLRANIDPATPLAIAEPLDRWMAAIVDDMHAMNQRDFATANAATMRAIELVDVIAPACGLR